jgi:hypothetical protein
MSGAYDQGSSPDKLENDIRSKGTGWCTASGLARDHLAGGDFHVFYTKDSNEQYTVPRIAIRMLNGKISEIRGIGLNQELEATLVETAEEKGRTLPGFEKFQKATSDMKRLTEIDKRCFVRDENQEIAQRLDPELSDEDLRFIYEIDGTIASFGYESDPRIAQILQGRDVRNDYARIFNVGPERIALSEDDFCADTRIVYGWTLGQSCLETFQKHKGPLFVATDTDFTGCTSLSAIPQGTVFNGDANFIGCTSLSAIPQGTVFNGDANFDGCTSLSAIPQGTVFNGGANFYGCTSLRAIPQGTVFNGGADFTGCTSLSAIHGGIEFNEWANFTGCTSLTTRPK